MVLEWMKALMTPVVASLGLSIAYQQYRLHKQKIRSEAYERRAGVFRIVILTMQRVATGMPKDDDVLFRDYFSGTAEAPFLFGEDVLDYLEDMKKRLIDAADITHQHNDGALRDNPERDRILARRRDHLAWFRSQLLDGHKVFSRYLKLDMKRTTT